MPHALYVCLQDDNKIAAFGWANDHGAQPRPAEGLRRHSYRAGDLDLRDRPGYRQFDVAGECGDEARADLPRARSHGQVLAVSLLPGRIGCGASNRAGWDYRYSAD